MSHTVLSASIGCFTGLLLALLLRPRGMVGLALDAVLGSAGGLAMGWFVAPIAENAHDPDSLNVALVVGAVAGALMLVAATKSVRK